MWKRSDRFKEEMEKRIMQLRLQADLNQNQSLTDVEYWEIVYQIGFYKEVLKLYEDTRPIEDWYRHTWTDWAVSLFWISVIVTCMGILIYALK